MTHMHNTRNMQ